MPEWMIPMLLEERDRAEEEIIRKLEEQDAAV